MSAGRFHIFLGNGEAVLDFDPIFILDKTVNFQIFAEFLEIMASLLLFINVLLLFFHLFAQVIIFFLQCVAIIRSDVDITL